MSGRNSCNGGSSSRMVTGSPSIASKMPSKSARCSLRAAPRARRVSSAASAARMNRCTIGRRSPRNMCSVRHRPMPSAPNSPRDHRVLGQVGVGAHLEHAGSLSAQPSTVSNTAGRLSGVNSGTAPITTSPVVPLIEITSPSRTVDAVHGEAAAGDVDVELVRAAHRGLAPCRAPPRAAWLTSPPRDVRMPSAAIMPWMSSGDVSGRTRITCFAGRVVRLGVVGGEVHLADGRARRRVEALRDRVVLRRRDRTAGAGAGRAASGAMRSTPSRSSMSPSLSISTAILQRRRRGALADAHLQHEQTALLDR